MTETDLRSLNNSRIEQKDRIIRGLKDKNNALQMKITTLQQSNHKLSEEMMRAREQEGVYKEMIDGVLYAGVDKYLRGNCG